MNNYTIWCNQKKSWDSVRFVGSWKKSVKKFLSADRDPIFSFLLSNGENMWDQFRKMNVGLGESGDIFG